MPVVRPISIRSVPSLTGRTVLVTGANSGIGLEASRHLARLGATVLLGCRDMKKADATAAAIRLEHPKATLHGVAVDLGSLASIRAAAERMRAEFPELDVLANNAGVMAIPRTLTADGIEMQFGVNHLGTFALSALLATAIAARPEGRIIATSSLLAHRGQMDFDDLQGERGYDKSRAYNQSKLCNQLFTYELDRRWRAAGVTARSIACHPGYSATNLQARGPNMEGSSVRAWFAERMNDLMAQSPTKGAEATVIAVGSPDVQGGELVGFDGMMEMRGDTAIMAPPKLALDRDAARRLWEVSEKLSGITFAIGG